MLRALSVFKLVSPTSNKEDHMESISASRSWNNIKQSIYGSITRKTDKVKTSITPNKTKQLSTTNPFP